MLDDIAGTYGSRLFVAAGGVAVALLVLVGVLWLVRNRAPSPFVRGGKGRQQRLQVLDAAAIDARRRIVLIRRDGVEHLVMIGGPTDLVIESGIGDTSKLPMAQPTIASPVPLEALAAKEQTSPAARLEAPSEPARVANRQPAPATQLAAPPVHAAIEAPVAPTPDRLRPEPTPTAPAPRPAATAAPSDQPPPALKSSTFSAQPVAPQRIDPIIEEVEAADILDAARSRVLPPQPERLPQSAAASPPLNQVPLAPMLARDAYGESYDVSASEVTTPRKPASDFENVLEAEMNRLTADRAVPNTPTQAPARPIAEPVPPQQRRDPEVTPIVGGDAALQKEVARIFGEISADRDK